MMRFFGALVLLAFAASSAGAATPVTPSWSMNATIIEACSCPMFCQCYFTSKPAGHAKSGDAEHAGHDHMAHAAGDAAEAEHFCRANNVFQVNKGTYGPTKLDGAKFWLAMDLGDDFSDGTMKWFIIHFDPAVTKEQREGISTVLGHLYPVKWEQPGQVGADLPIEWKHEGDRAWAKLDGGKGGEVALNGGSVSRNRAEPVVIKNLKYWGAARHDGFVLMPNEIETYRLGENAFEFKNSNGFMITVDLTSKDL